MNDTTRVYAVIATDHVNVTPLVWLFASRAGAEAAARGLCAARVKSEPDYAPDDGAEILRLVNLRETGAALELYADTNEMAEVIVVRDLAVTP